MLINFKSASLYVDVWIPLQYPTLNLRLDDPASDHEDQRLDHPVYPHPSYSTTRRKRLSNSKSFPLHCNYLHLTVNDNPTPSFPFQN